ncbi:nicotinamide-nucleotide adenylyltransferase [Herminiimonas sp. KBW02]|uniref:AAA family ATPase n=1 Tax=Herminiimonas sp. KBW02 TaxID=2153363 RepID=UPI000F59862D|nr:ATP-binding protein [Herminiimonas sp. KBW02]RQO37263.1 nicotinamide-nucleotide adenylyltransferase [Herminiimonas sp. KBW02]
MASPTLRIALLGAESTGKSTLAAALAHHYQTAWVPEYLREFVEVHQRTPQAHEQILIARTQIAREDLAIMQANRYLFCDTTPLMTALYSEFYFGVVDAPLSELAHAHRYDCTIVAEPSNPWVADGLQRESDNVRQEVHKRLLRQLDSEQIAYLLVAGDTGDRVEQVAAYLLKQNS